MGVQRNLEDVFGGKLDPREIRRIARDHQEFTESSYVWRLLPYLTGFQRRDRWPVDGLTNLDAALQTGRGVLLVTAHHGFPHLIPSILRVHGYRTRQIVAELGRLDSRNEREEWLANAGRLKRYIFEHTQVYADALGPDDLVASLDVRPILTALSRNEILMIAGDGLRATDFVEMKLLGKRYPFPAGFMKIALLTRAAILPAFATPDESGKGVRTTINRALETDSNISLGENLQRFVDVFDAELRRAPQFWQRWKRPHFFENAIKWANDMEKDPFVRSRLPMKDGKVQ